MTLPTPYLWQREVYAAWTGWIQNAPCLLLLTCGWVKPTALTCHSATAKILLIKVYLLPLSSTHIQMHSHTLHVDPTDISS